MYRFRRFDLRVIPKAQRGKALELQIRQWSPYVSTGQYVSWTPDHALVWVWDAGRLGVDLNSLHLGDKQVEILPETLLHPQHESGIFLCVCMEGCEGQIWSESELIFSRWWVKVPEDAEWLNFQRDAGVVQDRQVRMVPLPVPFPLQPQAWAADGGLGAASAVARGSEAILVAFVASTLALLTFWYSANFLKLSQAVDAARVELQTLERSVGPELLARSKAQDEIKRIRELRLLALFPDQLSVMAKVAEKLQPANAILKEWEFRSGKLKIVVDSATKMISSDFVKIFQVGGVFENVQATSAASPNNLTLTMDLIASANIKFGKSNPPPSVDKAQPPFGMSPSVSSQSARSGAINAEGKNVAERKLK